MPPSKAHYPKINTLSRIFQGNHIKANVQFADPGLARVLRLVMEV